MASLGLVLATDREADARLAVRLVRAALARGVEARVFLMHRGLAHAGALGALADDGAEVSACETQLAGRALPPGVQGGSQYDHAQLVRDCDAVVCLA